MFRKGEQEDVRHVSERYIGKSDPYIVMVSTPGAPENYSTRLKTNRKIHAFTNVLNWIGR